MYSLPGMFLCVKLCIVLYNTVYLQKLHFKSGCGNIMCHWPLTKNSDLDHWLSTNLHTFYLTFALTMVTDLPTVAKCACYTPLHLSSPLYAWGHIIYNDAYIWKWKLRLILQGPFWETTIKSIGVRWYLSHEIYRKNNWLFVRLKLWLPQNLLYAY